MRGTAFLTLAAVAALSLGIWHTNRSQAEDQAQQAAQASSEGQASQVEQGGQQLEQASQAEQSQQPEQATLVELDSAKAKDLERCGTPYQEEPAPAAATEVATQTDGESAAVAKTDETTKTETSAMIKPGRIPEFVTKGVAWLIAAQQNDGGWGAGSHAHQDVRDPHAVPSDPATTSFTLLALLRGGHTPAGGQYQAQVRKGLEYLLGMVEKAPKDGPMITDVEQTQPQVKLGRFVDTAMTAQYLARALALLPKEDVLHDRVDKALDICLAKLQKSQKENGSWGDGSGWAPVLQSSLSCSALELAQASGKQVDATVLDRARSFQKGNYNAATGAVNATEAAGVQLYAFNGAFRGNAADARAADTIVADAKARGVVAHDAAVSEETLVKAGAAAGQGGEAQKLAAAYTQNQAQMAQLSDESLLSGFGNNGGEEFLSYLMTSETLVIAGGNKFSEWQDKMQGRLAKIQNTDGSWSGQHCITSPVFCTAAVVQCIAADQDVEFLVKMAHRTTGEATESRVAAAK